MLTKASTDTTPRLATPTGSPPRLPIKSASKELGIFILLVVLCVVASIKNPNFAHIDNVQNLSRLIGLFGIFSLGLGLIIITSGIDLTVGSVFALSGVILSIILTEKHWNPVLSVFTILALTMGLGLIHGLLITKIPLQPFIVTLCGLLFYRGIARFIAGDETKGFGNAQGFEALQKLATGDVAGVPMPFVLLMVFSLIMWVVLHRSVYGRHLYAVGRNEEAARYSGINSQRVIITTYVIAGVLTGFSAILFAFYTNSISPSTHGNSYELYGIAAAVLGGCSLRGGEGSILGILIGAALIQVLQNLVNLLGIPSSLNFAVMGSVILLGVIADELTKRRAAKVK
ncbi:sugar ABC transporter permease [Capsulimonas corticalis]|uniref:Sugar ABC transporter permease n=1 Tax=Capsulimonas corticalis TaxID=2219043 RepID=A0A402CY46_9BACT|nr:ABC transporter permease [Capsulimonas corticalis]BDI31459.1 sugar ABC transporter permease [Capsulimonas corticalis]